MFDFATSESRSVNLFSNLAGLEVVIFLQCIENQHRKPTSSNTELNTTTLMTFELWLTLLFLLVLSHFWDIAIQHVSHRVQG